MSKKGYYTPIHIFTLFTLFTLYFYFFILYVFYIRNITYIYENDDV
jgi:hypothetical protein